MAAMFSSRTINWHTLKLSSSDSKHSKNGRQDNRHTKLTLQQFTYDSKTAIISYILAQPDITCCTENKANSNRALLNIEPSLLYEGLNCDKSLGVAYSINIPFNVRKREALCAFTQDSTSSIEIINLLCSVTIAVVVEQ